MFFFGENSDDDGVTGNVFCIILLACAFYSLHIMDFVLIA